MAIEQLPHIEGYEFLHRLGKGGMASIFAAREIGVDRVVAIKVVSLENELSDEQNAAKLELVNRLEIEARALAKLRHANIVELYRFGKIIEGNTVTACYYIMPLLEGGDLSAWLRPAPEAKVLSLLASVLPALDHAHRAGIVHRDIKPENILFDNERALLADFGAAFSIGEARVTQTGFSIGSVGYMSPEQARGFAVNGSSDLYSLAVVAFELLTAQRPHDGTDALAIALAQVESPPKDLPPELVHWQAFFKRALAAKQQDRFPDALAMRDALPGLDLDASRALVPLVDPEQRTRLRAAAPISISQDTSVASSNPPTPFFLRVQWQWPMVALTVALLVGAGFFAWIRSHDRAEESKRIAVLQQELAALPLERTVLRLETLGSESDKVRAELAYTVLNRFGAEFSQKVTGAPLSVNKDLLNQIVKVRDLTGVELPESLTPSVHSLSLRTEETLRLSIDQWDRASINDCNDVSDALLKTQLLTAQQSKNLEDLLQQAATLPKLGATFAIEKGIELKLLREPSGKDAAFAVLAAPLSQADYRALVGEPLTCDVDSKVQACINSARASVVIEKLNNVSHWQFELPDQALITRYKRSFPQLKNYYALGADCFYVTNSKRPNVIARTWGGVRRVFGGPGAKPQVSSSCVGQQSFALDGSAQQALAQDARTVLVLVATKSL